nr:4'-phosphopantetheinyl transferase superfamily protein [Luteolibacter marinus]
MSADGPVGVDLEHADRAPTLLGCEEGFCHPDEIEELPADPTLRAGRLLELWTAKEALLKGLGTGMSLAPQSVSLASGKEDLAVDPRLGHFRRHRLVHALLDRHVACLAVPTAVTRIEIRCFHGS